jgi:hypothetical protein
MVRACLVLDWLCNVFSKAVLFTWEKIGIGALSLHFGVMWFQSLPQYHLSPFSRIVKEKYNEKNC